MNNLTKLKQYVDSTSTFDVALIELLNELYESSSKTNNYKVFAFNFNQVGTSNPTINTLVNELINFTFTRVSTGVFRLTMSGIFDSKKTVFDGVTYHFNSADPSTNGIVYVTRENSNSLLFTFVNDGVTDFNYELKIYN